LAALILPVGFYFYLLRFRRHPSIVVASAAPFRGAAGKRRLSFADWCFIIASVLLIVALARPRIGDERAVIRSQGIDIIIALDLSDSMRALDVPESVRSTGDLNRAIASGEVKNRLETAKEEVKQFILARPNDRIGLVGFADLAYSFAPPTLDHAWLLKRLEQLTPGMIGSATGIASPIGNGVNRLRNSTAPRRVLVLFTDGANTAVNRLSPLQAARTAKEFNVIIHTVGIGSSNAYVPAVTPFGRSFQPYSGEFDAKLLNSIAEATGGNYFHAADAEGMRQVMENINKLEKTSLETPKYIEFREYAPRLALAVLFFLLLGYGAASTWKLRLP